MYYEEVLSILKQGPVGLKARRTCWEESHIVYDRYMGTITFTRRHTFEDGTLMTSCYNFIPSHSDCTHDDWEIFE